MKVEVEIYSSSENLPDMNVSVLCFLKDSDYPQMLKRTPGPALLSGEGEWHWSNSDYFLEPDEVTHWFQLPERPIAK